MRTILSIGSVLLVALGIVMLVGCGAMLNERAYAPKIRSVTLENTSALNYPAVIGNTLTCRANITTRHGSPDAIATFVIGSVTRAVVMVNEAATLTLTPDMVGLQTTAQCVVTAHVDDSRKVSRGSNSIQVYPSRYRAPCGTPVQQLYDPCPSSQFGLYVGQGGVSVNYRRN
jgi:hypothetical protein